MWVSVKGMKDYFVNSDGLVVHISDDRLPKYFKLGYEGESENKKKDKDNKQ